MKKAAPPTAPAINTPPIAPPTTSGRAPVEPLLLPDAPVPNVGIAVIVVVGVDVIDGVVVGEEPKEGEFEGVNVAEGDVVGDEPCEGEFDAVEEVDGESVIGTKAAPAGAV